MAQPEDSYPRTPFHSPPSRVHTPPKKTRSQKGTPYCKRKRKSAQSFGTGRPVGAATHSAHSYRRPDFVPFAM